MRNELIQALSEIKEIDLITKMLVNMNNRDIFILSSLLDHTDNDTQHRWLDTYNELIKLK